MNTPRVSTTTHTHIRLSTVCPITVWLNNMENSESAKNKTLWCQARLGREVVVTALTCDDVSTEISSPLLSSTLLLKYCSAPTVDVRIITLVPQGGRAPKGGSSGVTLRCAADRFFEKGGVCEMGGSLPNMLKQHCEKTTGRG